MQVKGGKGCEWRGEHDEEGSQRKGEDGTTCSDLGAKECWQIKETVRIEMREMQAKKLTHKQKK